MASDFSNVTASLSADGNNLTIAGKATTSQTQNVHVSSVISAGGDSETVESDGTRTITVAETTTITSVSDDLGGVWVIAADGQSAHQG